MEEFFDDVRQAQITKDYGDGRYDVKVLGRTHPFAAIRPHGRTAHRVGETVGIRYLGSGIVELLAQPSHPPAA
ncbi:MAG TPA: hypothetical protein VGO93_31585 [Candidatus Xenobia bacterium]